MVKVYERYRNRAVEFISVDVGERGPGTPEELVAKFRKRHGVTWPIVLDEEGYSKAYAPAVPVNLIIDRQGMIRAYRPGTAPGTWFRDHLDLLLGK